MLDNYHNDDLSRFERGPHVKLVPNSNGIQDNVTISEKSFVHKCKVDVPSSLFDLKWICAF